MTKFKSKFRIETTRLSGWDYSNPGWYFVTINTKNHIEHFGKIINAKMILNDIGKIADKCWTGLPKHFVNIELDYYVIMPNHIHGIIIINEHTNDYGREVACNVSTTDNIYSRISPQKKSLSVIVRSFKSAVSKHIHEIGFTEFAWKSHFYDRIIRSEKELFNTRKYISGNPLTFVVKQPI